MSDNVNIDELVEGFISLRRLNRRGVIVMDSDKKNSSAELNETKKRLQTEFDDGPGFAWITDGREIENYLAPDWIKNAIGKVHPTKTSVSMMTQWDNTLKVRNGTTGKIDQANKMKIANEIVSSCTPKYERFGLGSRMNRLIEFIKESNPTMTVQQ